MSSDDRVFGIRRVFVIGNSLACVLDRKWCIANKIKVRDSVIQFDRGSKMTVQKYADHVRDKMIDNKVQKHERLKLP